jgi:hypothetical protein
MKQEQCTSLPVTVGDFSPTSSLDTSQLSLLSGMDTPVKSLENEQQTDGSLACECGQGTLDCLIHPSTPESWTAFMRDSLARTLALLESRQAYMKAPDQVFTAKSCELLAWYDQSSCSWKTYQQSLVTDWEPYSETWPRWGMTQGGSAYAHPMSERRITETDGFYLPTPTCNMVSGGANHNSPSVIAGKHGLNIAGAVAMWPTPTTNDAKNATLPESQKDRDGMAGALMRQGVQAGGKLNPLWVEWLMAFPIGFTASKDWVTPSVQSRRQQRFASSVGKKEDSDVRE